MKNEHNVEGALIILMAILVALWALWLLESKQPDMQAAQYCEMVELYKTSGGENGWPDYNGTASTTCSTGVDANK